MTKVNVFTSPVKSANKSTQTEETYLGLYRVADIGDPEPGCLGTVGVILSLSMMILGALCFYYRNPLRY